MKTNFEKMKFDFVKKSKYFLYVTAGLILISLIFLCIFGLNYSIELRGGHSFSVTVGEELNTNSTFVEYSDSIKQIMNDNGLSVYSIQKQGEFVETSLYVRYSGEVDETKIQNIETDILAEYSSLTASDISEHLEIEGVLTQNEIFYAYVAIVVGVVLVALYFVFRFDVAEALSTLICVSHTILFVLSLATVTRISIGANFYAILGLMVAYTLFELNSMYEFMRNTKSNTAEIIKPNILVNKTIKNNLLRFMFGSGMFAVVFLVMLSLGSLPIKMTAIAGIFGLVGVSVSVLFVNSYFWTFFTKVLPQKTKKIKPKSKEEKA